MVRAIGLLILLVALELILGDLHPWEFLAHRVPPPIQRSLTVPQSTPRPFDGMGVNPMLNSPKVNDQVPGFGSAVPAQSSLPTAQGEEFTYPAAGTSTPPRR